MTGVGERPDAVPNTIDWSPDGSKLLLELGVTGTGVDVYTMNRDGTGLTDISQDPVAALSPNWSPRP